MIKRRQFLLGSASLSIIPLSACSTTSDIPKPVVEDEAQIPSNYQSMYGPLLQERFPIPGIDLTKVSRKFWRRQVDFSTEYPVGSIIVNTKSFYLHLVQPNGKAMRYGVGLGRQGFEWSGDGIIQWKQKWPTWTPPAEMIARQPELEKWSAENGGQPPGLGNALGARALYIFKDGKDTLYRIHGTPEYWTIGKAVSSGCVRMINHDVIDLYQRVSGKNQLIVI
ncbi:L,D-transpeptidase [Ahrensia marina]|uniref:L,D-TPase catalytic domain-containing protein n=1 Tax=Ahrensia marina TaxID=1514904 RepID=A0A0M9GKT0_9HYPH|nr:L,D-transpeptidase [Ahrensia marina]KPB00053.1 hypothetical protein SU32_15895 [Ahrensia marina]